MNVPTGEPIERGRKVQKIKPRDYITNLMSKSFTGYTTVTIHGETGLEEGIIAYKNGEIVSSSYMYFRYNEHYRAEEGVERSINALNSRNGIIDTYKLSSHQIQLVLTLNEECALEEPIDREKLKVPTHFNTDYEESLIKEETRELTQEELMKKYGLTGLQGAEDTGGQLLQKAREEHRTLRKFLEKEKSSKK